MNESWPRPKLWRSRSRTRGLDLGILFSGLLTTPNNSQCQLDDILFKQYHVTDGVRFWCKPFGTTIYNKGGQIADHELFCVALKTKRNNNSYRF